MDTNEDENEDEGVDKFVVGQCGSSDISGGSSRVIIHPQPATSQGPVTHIWYSYIQLLTNQFDIQYYINILTIPQWKCPQRPKESLDFVYM